MIYSVYGEAAFFISFGATAVLFLICFAIAAGFVSRTLYKRALVSRAVRIVTATTGFLSGVFLSLNLSTLSSFGFIHPAGAMLLCALAWALLTPFITACFAPATRLNRMMERTTASQIRIVDEEQHVQEERQEQYNMLTQAQQIIFSLEDPATGGREDPNNGDTELVASSQLINNSATPNTNNSSGVAKRRGGGGGGATARSPGDKAASSGGGGGGDGASDDSDLETVKSGAKAWLLRVNPALRGVVLDIIRRPIPHFTTFFGGLIISLVLVLTTYDVCFCNQPKVLTTWATRYGKSKVCTPGEVCFQYSLVGGNCSELVVVAHFVAKDSSGDDSTVPKLFTTEVCPSDGCGASITPTIARGWVTPHAHISEDPRYIGTAVLSQLDGLTNYRVKVSFTLGDGTIVVSKKTLLTRTVPCFDGGSDSNITFIGGGDWRVGGLGKKILLKSMERYPSAAFVYIGGDLAYANNMRTCYMRWDTFLDEFIAASTRPQDGALLPFLAAVGNHEGGGYLLASSFTERQDNYFFYHQYFPHAYSSLVDPTIAVRKTTGDGSSTLAPGVKPQIDPSTTFHTHAIGSTLGIIVLDSDIMHSVKSQVEFLRTSLGMLPKYQHTPASGGPIAQPTATRRIIVVYHNPAYPSHREFDDPISQSVREHFIPAIEESLEHVAFVLEHHDHTYKRTHPLRGGKVINNTAVDVAEGSADSNERGLVYIGDGALGVSESSREAYQSRAYIEVAKSENYFLGIVVLPNRSMACVAHEGESGEVMDSYSRT